MGNSIQITNACIIHPLSAATLALILLMSCNEKTTTMNTLYTNLTNTDASEITAFLKENKYGYKLDSNGKAIYVPTDSVYKIRMNLAMLGLPKYKGVEFFDRNMLGTTDYVRDLNYWRAAETEIARTIEALGEVEKVAHIFVPDYIPRKLIYREKKINAKVVVKLQRGKNLQERQVKGIQHLVAIAFEEIEASEVEVFYTEGNQFSNFTDQRDGKTYKTIKIGKQIWLAENLNYAAEGSKCGYEKIRSQKELDSIYEYGRKNRRTIDPFPNYSLKDENTDLCDKYGRLYSWETAVSVCPEGWHLPSFEEWEELIDALGGFSMYGLMQKVKSWADGKDSSGFDPLPGGYGWVGYGWGNGGHYEANCGAWWSSTEHTHSIPFEFSFAHSISNANWNVITKSTKLNSVRCVGDK